MLDANGAYLQAPHNDPRSSAREHIVLLSGGEHGTGGGGDLFGKSRSARVKISGCKSRRARCPE